MKDSHVVFLAQRQQAILANKTKELEMRKVRLEQQGREAHRKREEALRSKEKEKELKRLGRLFHPNRRYCTIDPLTEILLFIRTKLDTAKHASRDSSSEAQK